MIYIYFLIYHVIKACRYLNHLSEKGTYDLLHIKKILHHFTIVTITIIHNIYVHT